MVEKKFAVLNILPESAAGGAHIVAKQLTELLINRGVNSDLYFLDSEANSFNDLGSISIINLIPKFKRFFGSVLAVRKLKKSGDWDAVISHVDRADWVNFLSGKACPSYAYSHGSKLWDINYKSIGGFIRKSLTFLSYKFLTGTICVSDGLRKELAEVKFIDSSKLHLVYNWRDYAELLNLEREPLEEKYQGISVSSRFIFMTHSRLTQQKSIEDLLLSFSLANFENDPMLVIVGDGEEYEKLKNLSVSLGLKTSAIEEDPNFDQDQVIFVGFQANPFKFLRHGSAYVTTSIWEGFPLAILEALLLNKKVIANRCFHGPEEMIEYNNQCFDRSVDFSFSLPMKGRKTDIDLWVKYLEEMSLCSVNSKSVPSDFVEKFSAEHAFECLEKVLKIENSSIG